jgi:hypothetical protein
MNLFILAEQFRAIDLFFFAILGIISSVNYFFWLFLNRVFKIKKETIDKVIGFILLYCSNIVIVAIPFLSFLINTIFGFSIIDFLTDDYGSVILWTIFIMSTFIMAEVADFEEVKFTLIFSSIILISLFLIYLHLA